MVVRAILASLLLAMQPSTDAPAPIFVRDADPSDPARWRCSYSVEHEEGVVNVTRSFDAEGRAVYDYVNWQPRLRLGTSAIGWDRRDPVTSTALPWTLRSDQVVATLTLSRTPRRPVWLVLRVVGRIASRRLLFRRWSDVPDHDRDGLDISPEIRSIPASMGPMPDLTGAREVVISAEEEGGETLARRAIPLPDRTLIDAAIAEAAPALAAIVPDGDRCRDERREPVPAPEA